MKALMIPLVVFVALLAGSIVKGAMGLGLPLISIPVLSLFFGVPQALSIVVVPMVATNLFQIWQFRRAKGAVPFLLPFLILGGVGTAAGTWFLASASPRAVEIALAFAVFVYLTLRLSRSDFSLSMKAGRTIAPAAGLGAGILQGATGISGPIGVTFFHALELERAAFMYCSAAMFLMFATVQLALLTYAGIATQELLLLGLFGLVPAAIGLPLGNRIARHMNRRVFDRVILVLLAATAIPLAWRGLMG